ncbi:hypothetical protein DL765_000671 [Monosporascus sp. GIB2]|nr:hypothetical protein DL765_000671 [Monosporascus sp. GIB2]
MTTVTCKESKDILESGFLADVTLKCGSREWKLHKLILATRSRWFKAALCGNFLEAQSNEITLRDMDPTVLDWAVSWIYTKTLPQSIFEDETTLYEAYVNLSTVADFLRLDDLFSHVTSHLRENLHRKMIWFQKVFLADEDSQKQKETYDIRGWFKGAEVAFKKDIKWAKAAFLQVLADAHYWMLPHEDFQFIYQSIPELACEVLKDLAKLAVDGLYMPNFKPKECAYDMCDLKLKQPSNLLSAEKSLRNKVEEQRLTLTQNRQELSTCSPDRGAELRREISINKRLLTINEVKLRKYESFYWAKLSTEHGQPIAYCNKCIMLDNEEDD